MLKEWEATKNNKLLALVDERENSVWGKLWLVEDNYTSEGVRHIKLYRIFLVLTFVGMSILSRIIVAK